MSTHQLVDNFAQLRILASVVDPIAYGQKWLHQLFYLTDSELASASAFRRKCHLISIGNDVLLENGRNALMLRRSTTV